MKKILACVVMTLAAACGSSSNDVDAGTPTIAISGGTAANGTAIKDNGTAADGFVVNVTVTDLTLVNFAPGGNQIADVPGEGHFHIYMDNDSGGDYIGQAFATAGCTPSTTGGSCTVAVPASKPTGPHTIYAQLETNNHVPIGARSNTVTITVVGP